MVFRSGYVALLGKPNVGKSTLVNDIVGEKISIVSSKPQTTRRRVVGWLTKKDYQIAFVDTPGFHEPHTQLGKAMNDSARSAISGVDVVLVVCDISKRPDDLDKKILQLVKPDPSHEDVQIVLALNKMDLLKPDFVTEHVQEYCDSYGTEDYMLTTATRGFNIKLLLDLLVSKLPEGEMLYPDDEYTDQSSRFIAAELIREKVLIKTRQEVPHATAVMIEEWEDDDYSGKLQISASIIVEKASQRSILIGQKGQFIKQIGIESRTEIEKLVGRPVRLELFVKVREGWRMNPRMLHELEYLES